MSWFSRRKPYRQPKAGRIEEGPQHAPGLELLCERLRTRPQATVLDLGPTSTQSLSFLSRRSANVEVCDLFQSASHRGARAEALRFDADDLSLPAGRFGVLLVWDLLHYFDDADRPRFGRRLLDLAEDDALVLVTASNIAPIPPTPIHFKILGSDRLDYVFTSEPKLPSPGLHTRQVEKALDGFEPDRHFQLRNGLQELVFVRTPRVARADADRPR